MTAISQSTTRWLRQPPTNLGFETQVALRGVRVAGGLINNTYIHTGGALSSDDRICMYLFHFCMYVGRTSPRARTRVW